MSQAGGVVRARIKFETRECKGCGLCVDVCPKHIIKMSENFNQMGHRYAEVSDEDKCTGCGLCFQMCPDLVIEIEEGTKWQRHKAASAREYIEIKERTKAQSSAGKR